MSFGELRVGSLNQTGEPNRNGLTERTESEAVQYLRLERMATGVTGRRLPGATVRKSVDFLNRRMRESSRTISSENDTHLMGNLGSLDLKSLGGEARLRALLEDLVQYYVGVYPQNPLALASVISGGPLPGYGKTVQGAFDEKLINEMAAISAKGFANRKFPLPCSAARQ